MRQATCGKPYAAIGYAEASNLSMQLTRLRASSFRKAADEQDPEKLMALVRRSSRYSVVPASLRRYSAASMTRNGGTRRTQTVCFLTCGPQKLRSSVDIHALRAFLSVESIGDLLGTQNGNACVL